jgi:hypothetical protein
VVERLGQQATLHTVAGADHSFRVAGGTRDGYAIGRSLAGPAAAFAESIA